MCKLRNERYFAGLDVSTQSCKLVVINFDSKEVIFDEKAVYDVDLPQYNTRNGVIQGLPEGVSESDPDMWIKAVMMVFQRLRDSDVKTGNICSIAVSGQQHGLVSLDQKGNLSRSRCKLWNDFSTVEECAILTEKVGGRQAMIAEIGNDQRTGYTAAKIFSMFRHERELYDRTATFFLVHNYVNWFLTGGVNNGVRVMEPGDTSGMALWNIREKKWSNRVIEAIDPGLIGKLPKVRPSESSIGFISQELVDGFGFSKQCTIDAGCGDNMYSAVGTGNVQPGIITISLGSSGTVYTFRNEPFIDPEGATASFCDSTGNYLPLVCVSNLSNGYDAFIEAQGISHSDFNGIIAGSEAGNNGNLIIPWFTGERTPDIPLAVPVYFGFKPEDFNLQSLARGILEGHVQNLFSGSERLLSGQREIRLTGGLAKSDTWVQCIADIFGSEAVPVDNEGAALGAAIHAAWVWFRESENQIPLEHIVVDFVKLDERRRRKPDRQNVEVYKMQKKLYKALSNRIRGIEGDDVFALRVELRKIIQGKGAHGVTSP